MPARDMRSSPTRKRPRSPSQLSDLRPARNQGSVGGYRDIMRDQLFADMLGDRLDELGQGANPPFLRAAADRRLFPAPRTRDEATLQALVSNDGVARGLDALVTELQRVAQFGFTATELARAKQAMMLGYERSVTESPDRESASRADEYTRNFLERRSAADDLAGARVPSALPAGHHAARSQRADRRLVSRTEPARGRVRARSGRRRPARPGAAGGASSGPRRRSGSRPTSTPAAEQALMDATPTRRRDRQNDRPSGSRNHRVDAVERRDRRAEADDAEGGSDPVPGRGARAGRRLRAMPTSFPPASRDAIVAAGGVGRFSGVDARQDPFRQGGRRQAVHRRNQRGDARRQHAAGSRDDVPADVPALHAAARRSDGVRRRWRRRPARCSRTRWRARTSCSIRRSTPR